jgi:cell division protein FtsQ
VLGAVAILAALGFVEHSTDRTPVKELAVKVDAPEGVHFIDENAVREQVLANTDGVIGTAVGDVDVVMIEARLSNIGCVSKANVYHTMDGVLHVAVKQREPIVRVINSDGSSFYIDREGWTMPMSANYTARALVVTGQLFEPFAQQVIDLNAEGDSLRQATRSDEIYRLARTITADPLWNALFDQAVVDANGEFELIPRIGGQRVKVGHVGTDIRARKDALLDQRLAKLKTFYRQGIPQADWRRYSVIDTRFADQVVCTRRGDYRPDPIKKPASTRGNVAPTTR